MPEPAGSDWTTLEIDLIVADYFAMLNDELAGRAYVKAQHNAALQQLTGRGKGSIEFKHQNISAVLMRLGMRWIPGYKPMANYQGALIDGIGRFLALQPAWWTPPALADVPPVTGSSVREAGMLWVGPAPGARNVPPAPDPLALTRLLHTFDPAARDAANRGATVRTRCEVTALRRDGGGWLIEAGGETFHAAAVINAAAQVIVASA